MTLSRKLYLLLLTLLAVSLTTSNFVMNLAWVLLLVLWLSDPHWHDKWARFRHNRLLQAFVVLLVVHLVAMLWSSNLAYGFRDLVAKLPFFVVPLVVLSSPPLQQRERRPVLAAYLATLFVVTVIGWVRFFSMPGLPYRDIVPYISHIRFALNLCLAVCLVAYLLLRRRRAVWLYLLGGAYVLWMLLFLALIQSYSAFVILSLLVLLTLVRFSRCRVTPRLRRCLMAGVILLYVALCVVLASMVGDYYRLLPLSRQPLLAATVNGNAYSHSCDGLVESGNYLNNYVCLQELQQQWPRYSSLSLSDTVVGGYTVQSTLLRYLNAIGTTKDSVGLTLLSPADVAAIEAGVANPICLCHLSVRRMVYTLLFEIECYRCLGSLGASSLLHRFALWRAGWAAFAHHPIFGVGTGDVVDVCHQQLFDSLSPLAGTAKHLHNQYLTFLLSFGLLGFGLIVFFFIRAFRPCVVSLPRLPFPLFATLLIVLVSFLSEDTLETLAGCLFVAFFLTLFYPSPSLHQ